MMNLGTLVGEGPSHNAPLKARRIPTTSRLSDLSTVGLPVLGYVTAPVDAREIAIRPIRLQRTH
jgi:hypothetical protein